jgi:hypothetical protein
MTSIRLAAHSAAKVKQQTADFIANLKSGAADLF